MDFSNGLGISFGTNHSEFEEHDGDDDNYGEAVESNNNHQLHHGQQMEYNGETPGDQTSFESQLADPDITPRPNSSYQNQFTSINQASGGAQAQSYGQPYQYSQPSASFHPLGGNKHLQGHMNAILASQNDYGQAIPQPLQFGADPQFNNHGHPEYGFQHMSNQDRMDIQHGFGNSGMQPQQFTQNNNQRYVSPPDKQHQEDSGNSPSYNLQTYRTLYRNQEDFSQVSDCLSFQPRAGSLRASRFRPVQNQLGDQAQSSSSAGQGNMSKRNNKSSGRAPGKKGGGPEARYWNGFDTHRSMWPVQNWIIETILPGSCISHLTPGEQEGIITMMQRLGLDKWKITCNEDIQKFLDHMKSFKSQLYTKQAQLRAEAGLPELPPPEKNQDTQEGDDPPLQDTSSFSEISPNYVLTSNHGEPVFGQDPRDYRLVGMGHSHQPDDISFIPVGSEQEIVAGHKVSTQDLNSQLRPPPLITQHFKPTTFQPNYSMQNQQGYPLVHPSDLLHPSMDQGMNRPLDFSYQDVGFNGGPPQQYHHHGYGSQAQQYHHHGQPFEYSSFHGYSPHSPHPDRSNNADQNFHPAPPPETIEEYEEYEEDDEQQEEVTGTESQSQTAKQKHGQEQEQEQPERPQQEYQAIKTKREVDSDGWSTHADEMRSSPSNIYPITRPENMPSSPPRPQPRFPSNEINPFGARNKPPPIIGPGNRVWSIAPGAFDENGVIRDWDKAKRREIGEGNCGCKGLFHGDGKGFYYMDGDGGEKIWCDGREGKGVEEDSDDGEEEEDEDEDEGEEDEHLRGVPKWVKQALTHGPELDKNEERRKEVEYRAMMAREVKEILARKKAKERGEIPGFGFDGDFESMDVESLFDDAESFEGYDANRFDPKSSGKGKRKARTVDSEEDLDDGSPVKKWKGKGRAAESDEELDEREVARKYANKEKNQGKGKGKVFELPEETGVEDYLFGDSAETARWAEGLGLRPLGNEEEMDGDNDHHFYENINPSQGGYDTTRYPNNSELEHESATADPELAATGIILPATFPNPSHPSSEEEIEDIPRPAPYLSRRNPGPFNIFQSLLLTPEIILEFILHLSPQNLLTLYSICRPFHTILSHWMAHAIKSIVKHQAPYSYTIYPFYLYRELSIPDPLGTLNSSGQIRRVPSLKYHQMVLHRCRIVRNILASLARQHLRCPPGTNHALKKVWFLMDLSTTLDRVRLIHNRTFFTDHDLYNIQHFIVKLDMRLNCPTDGPGSDFLRKLMLGQRGLTPLCRLLTRTGFTDLYELYQYSVRYSYTPLTPAPDLHLGLFDVPECELGTAHLEGWGKGSKHLMRIDELVMREATRRELGFKEHIMMMLLWGYVDPLTGENLRPSREEVYMSDGEGEEAESEGDPWEGTGMNMQRLEQVVLGRAEESDGDEDEDDEQQGEEEWEDENDFEDDPWL